MEGQNKSCRGCGESKPLDLFYREPKNRDGRMGRCKSCVLAASNKWIEEHRDRFKAKRREWYRRNPEREKKKKANYTDETKARLRASEKAWKDAHPDRKRAHQEKWAKANPEKRKAHRLVNNAVRRGSIIKPSECQRCGRQGRVEGHHEDYAKPLEVVWLCPKCHMARRNVPAEVQCG